MAFGRISFAWATVIESSYFGPGLPKFSQTFSTEVGMIGKSAPKTISLGRTTLEAKLETRLFRADFKRNGR
jgi:hypothetical protein